MTLYLHHTWIAPSNALVVHGPWFDGSTAPSDDRVLVIADRLAGALSPTPELTQDQLLIVPSQLAGALSPAAEVTQDQTFGVPPQLAGSIVDSPEVTQDQTLGIAGQLAGAIVGSPELTQDQTLTVSGQLAGSLSPLAELTQDQLLDVSDYLAGSIVSAVVLSLEVEYSVVIADVLAGALSPSADLTQAQTLAASAVLAGSIVSSVEVTTGGGLPITTGLVWNLDAREITVANGAAVPSWSDISASANDVTQATETKQPIYRTGQTPSGGPTVTFDGIDDDLLTSVTPITGATDRTIYVVFRQSGGHAGSRPCPVSMSPAGAGNGLRFGITTEPGVRVITGYRLWTPGVTVDQFELLIIRLSGTTVAGLSARRNRLDLSVIEEGATSTAINTQSGGAAVGLYNLLDEWFKGDISHILAYTGAHSVAQVAETEDYLYTAWFGAKQLIVGGVIAGSIVDSLEITQNQTLSVLGQLAGSIVDLPGVTQGQTLLLDGYLAGSLITEPELSQGQILAIDDYLAGSIVDSLEITQGQLVVIADQLSGSIVSEVTLTFDLAAGILVRISGAYIEIVQLQSCSISIPELMDADITSL